MTESSWIDGDLAGFVAREGVPSRAPGGSGPPSHLGPTDDLMAGDDRQAGVGRPGRLGSSTPASIDRDAPLARIVPAQARRALVARRPHAAGWSRDGVAPGGQPHGGIP
jgi:hypothetical protein